MALTLYTRAFSRDEKWREEFSATFLSALGVDGFDSEKDARSSTPWQAPWFYEREEDFAVSTDAAYCGERWANINRDTIAEIISEEAYASERAQAEAEA